MLFYDRQVEIHAPSAGRSLFGAQVLFHKEPSAVEVGRGFSASYPFLLGKEILLSPILGGLLLVSAGGPSLGSDVWAPPLLARAARVSLRERWPDSEKLLFGPLRRIVARSVAVDVASRMNARENHEELAKLPAPVGRSLVHQKSAAPLPKLSRRKEPCLTMPVLRLR